MAKTSTKRRNILIASLIVVVLVVSSIGAVIYLLTKDDVKVSGEALVIGFVYSNIQTIEFQDTQTSTVTTFHFASPPQSAANGNYSVTLKNGHSYNVYISFYVFSPENSKTHFITTFTVSAPAGQSTITKNFATYD